MDERDIRRRFQGLSSEMQVLTLATFGHNLTIAARDTCEPRAPGVQVPQRLRQINEIQHHVFAQISALCTEDQSRYPDDVLWAILVETDDDDLRHQIHWAMKDAVERVGE